MAGDTISRNEPSAPNRGLGPGRSSPPSGVSFLETHNRTRNYNMARLRVYKLYATGVATASAVASVTIPQAGLITAIQWAGKVDGGAAVASGITTELSTSSVSTMAVNDTPGNSLSSFCVTHMGVNSSSGSANLAQSNLGIPVNAGDKLYFHQTIIGTAPTGTAINCHITVMH